MGNLSGKKVDVGTKDCSACGRENVKIIKDSRDSVYYYFENHHEPGSGQLCPQSEVLIGVC
ncbi:hypothetical protein L6248_00555 [Candidatus Parcubacteria bacterium]|nr:hypothetical protein [Candidatus Parcubacteria bacterium]